MDGLEDWKVNPEYHGNTKEMEIFRLVGEGARKSDISIDIYIQAGCAQTAALGVSLHSVDAT